MRLKKIMGLRNKDQKNVIKNINKLGTEKTVEN